jgi:hypothetical protein
LSAFADRYRIHARRLSRWASEIEGEGEPLAFHRVRLVQGSEGEQGGAPLEIDVGAALTVRVLPGFAAEDLARVLEVLGVGAGC